ncbi:MAG: ABC transporter ATP-binding protein [Peptococcaceae bacterium]|jgi:NitT/TauT family transport system ATP-binding protein|nr:ABC transporter ATP-binding protein [Peptococcaceae bacterium]
MSGNAVAVGDIQIQNISRIFNVARGGKKKEQFTALEDFSLDVSEGEFVTIVGSSGCGKSTLLDLVAGLSFPNTGSILIGGEKIVGPSLDRGFVMQGYALFPWRTVKKNVEFGLEIQKIDKKDRARIADEYIEMVGLSDFSDRYPHELSGGMRQRVAIVRALAYNPKILLMDEPFAAVDAQTRETLQEELLRIWQKTRKTIVFITHSIEEAVFLAQRVAVMTSSPGKVKEIIAVDIPYPRKLGVIKQSPDFQWISNKVWKSLHNIKEDEQREPIGENHLESEIDSEVVL